MHAYASMHAYVKACMHLQGPGERPRDKGEGPGGKVDRPNHMQAYLQANRHADECICEHICKQTGTHAYAYAVMHTYVEAPGALEGREWAWGAKGMSGA